MTKFDKKMVPLALKMVKKYGKSVTYRHIQINMHDPTTGGTRETAPKDYSVKITPPEAVHLRFVDGGAIKVGDMRTFLPASGLAFTPAIDDTLTVDTIKYRVISVSPVYTGTSIALFALHMRRG